MEAAPRSSLEPNEEDIEQIVETRLSAMRNGWKPQVASQHNPFLRAIAPELVQTSNDTRRITSKLGNVLEAISNDIVKLKYPGAVKQKATSKSLLPEDLKMANRKKLGINRTAVFSRYSSQEVLQVSQSLTRAAKEGLKIGSDQFDMELKRKLDRVVNAPKDKDIVCYGVDLICLNSDIGFVEIKTGGALDSKKAEVEIQRLIAAYLAHGDVNVPFRFATLYANQGEGKRIKGSVPKFFTQNGPVPGMPGLAVGSQWWDLILPSGMNYLDFEGVFARVAERYRVGGYLKPESGSCE